MNDSFSITLDINNITILRRRFGFDTVVITLNAQPSFPAYGYAPVMNIDCENGQSFVQNVLNYDNYVNEVYVN